MKLSLIIAISIMTSMPLTAQPIAHHQWKDRLILLFSPQLEGNTAIKQLDHFQEDQAAVKERDLLIYQISPKKGLGPKGTLSVEQLEWFYNYYHVGKDEFNLLLIGKDGSEKLRSERWIDRQKVFDLIDGMPMRRAEMKNNK